MASMNAFYNTISSPAKYKDYGKQISEISYNMTEMIMNYCIG
jgi:hypothetical protein